jgi:hypothetical protein
MISLKEHDQIINNTNVLLYQLKYFLLHETTFNKKINIFMQKNKYDILTPCPINNLKKILNIVTLKKYVFNDVKSNYEYFNDANLTYTISNPTKAEWIIYKSIKNSLWIGKGNNKADVLLQLLFTNIYIDVGVLTLNGNQTNEKSIMQNFTQGNNLDELFINKKGSDAVNIFKNKLIEKYQTQTSPLNKINKYYYMLFICHEKNIHLTCFNFNQINIQNMSFESFIGSEYKNILIRNFIDIKYGNVKLYKSKKRLELRLNKNIINESCSIKLY